MRSHIAAATAIAALTAVMSSVPAAAGTVYVSLVADQQAGDASFWSRLVVTNTGTQPHFFVVRFIESAADGTERDPGASAQVLGVPPGETYTFDGLGVPEGKAGMLEITGDDALVFQASVVSRIAGVEKLPVQVPILDGPRWVAAGRRMMVEDLRRDSEYVSGIVLLNLEAVATTCTMAVSFPTGQLAVGPVTLALPPLSQSFYADVLEGTSIVVAADMRFEATCGGRAYAFGLLGDRDGAALTMLDLAVSLESTLVPPGEEPPAAQCPTTAVCVELPGVFHVATKDNRSFRQKIPVAAGRTFRRIDLEVTVTHGGWDKKYPDGIHNVFWLFSQKFAGATWAYANARGPNRDLVTLSHNIGLGVNQNSRSAGDLALVPGSTYHVRYTYDTLADLVELVWSTPDGTELVRLTDRPTVDAVSFQGDGFEVWFGIEGAHQIEVPSIGWAFRDARIQFSG